MITGYLYHLMAVSCTGHNFLFFPPWYKYLDGVTDPSSHLCSPVVTGLNDIWLIVAAVIEILLRVVALIAVVMIIYAGFYYTTSQGEPDKTAKAKGTIINAVAGLILAVLATTIITFLAGSFN